MYKEVRIKDFDNMKSYLADLIPKKVTTESVCRVLSEIWMGEDYAQDEDPITEEEETPESELDDGEELKISKPDKGAWSEINSFVKQRKAVDSKSVGLTKVSSVRSDYRISKQKKDKDGMLTLSEISDENSETNISNEDDVIKLLVKMIQTELPDIYESEDAWEDLLKLPGSVLKYLFESDQTCAPELTFFEILNDLAMWQQHLLF